MATTTGTGAKKINGTDNWRDIFDDHNDTVDAYDGLLGTTTLPTTAQTLTGAIAEHETDITGLSDQIVNHVSCSKHSKSNLTTTAGTALVVDNLSTYIPTGKQFMGLSKIMCSGGDATDYGMLQLNSSSDKIIYMPTVTQSSVTLQFSIYYK